jgi:hypothetical protein
LEEIFRQTKHFKQVQQEIRNIQPIRIGIFKKYWNKFKYNKKRREYLIELFDNADI